MAEIRLPPPDANGSYTFPDGSMVVDKRQRFALYRPDGSLVGYRPSAADAASLLALHGFGPVSMPPNP